MNLNSLKLPDSVISGLYNKSLVITEKDNFPVQNNKIENDIAEVKTEVTLEEKIQFLGENKKNILIAVNNENTKFLPDEELSFLTNMLTACKLSLADVAIVNLNKTEITSYKKLFDELKSSIVLLFGTDPSALQLPVSFPHFQVQAFNNHTFLFTPSLNEIQNDKVLKSKLWVCLRRIFNI